jgi:hypothetical protein
VCTLQEILCLETYKNYFGATKKQSADQEVHQASMCSCFFTYYNIVGHAYIHVFANLFRNMCVSQVALAPHAVPHLGVFVQKLIQEISIQHVRKMARSCQLWRILRRLCDLACKRPLLQSFFCLCRLVLPRHLLSFQRL